MRDGLTRKAKLPPYEEGEPTLWAIGFEGKSPLRFAEAEHYPLHVSLAFDDELTEQQKRDLEEEWGVERETTLHFHKFTSGAAGELPQVGPRGQLGERAAGPRLQLLWPATAAAHQLLVKMEERRRGGFRVKPSFGQVLGYIQEGEPLALDLPNRKASIYTSSHFYLDDYPNRQRDASAPHDAEPGGCVRDCGRRLRWGPLPSPAQRVHEAVLPARQRRWGRGSRPGPDGAKAASKPRRRSSPEPPPAQRPRRGASRRTRP